MPHQNKQICMKILNKPIMAKDKTDTIATTLTLDVIQQSVSTVEL